MLRGARCDVSEGPSSFELSRETRLVSLYTTELSDQTHLKHRLASLEEFNEASDDAALDDLLDRRVLFFREQLPELGRRVELAFRIVAEHGGEHLLRKIIRDKWRVRTLINIRRVAYRRVPAGGRRLFVGVGPVDDKVAPFSDVFFALLPSDLHLLLFAAAAKLILLEGLALVICTRDTQLIDMHIGRDGQ